MERIGGDTTGAFWTIDLKALKRFIGKDDSFEFRWRQHLVKVIGHGSVRPSHQVKPHMPDWPLYDLIVDELDSKVFDAINARSAYLKKLWDKKQHLLDRDDYSVSI